MNYRKISQVAEKKTSLITLLWVCLLLKSVLLQSQEIGFLTDEFPASVGRCGVSS
jgi:hypothetical protein